MAEHSFTQTFDIDHAVEAYGIHYTSVRSFAEKRNIFIAMFLVLFGLSFVLGKANDVGGPLWLAMWLAISAAVAAAIAWLPKRWSTIGLRGQIEANRKRMGVKSDQTVYRFDDETLQVEDDVLGGRIDWKELHGWHESDSLILIYRGPLFFYYIAKSAVDPVTLKAFRKRLLSSPAKRI